MNQDQIIQQLLLKKYQKQRGLYDKLKDIEVIEQDLSIEQFGRFFGTSYLVIKRMITLIMAIIILLLALILLIQPDLIINDNISDELIGAMGEEFRLSEEVHIENTWKTVYDNRLSRRDFALEMTEMLKNSFEQDLSFSIHFIGYVLLILGLLTFYVSRLTRKMWIRNNRISKAQLLNKELMEDFKSYIQEETEEIASIEELQKLKQPPNHPS